MDNLDPVRKQILDKLKNLNNFRITIEIDDENTSVNGATRTNGLEVLKRKLLHLKGWEMKVISSKEVEVCGDDEQAVAALLLHKIHS